MLKPWLSLPPILPHKRHKSASADIFLRGLALIFTDEQEFLAERAADRDHQPAAFCQLFNERFGDRRRSRCHDYPVIRREFFPAFGAVAYFYSYIFISEAFQDYLRLLRQ